MFSLYNSYLQLAFLLVLCGALLGQEESKDGQLQTETQHCPTLTYFNKETNSCRCGPVIHHIVTCSVEDLIKEFSFGMTQNKERTKVVVGPCPTTAMEISIIILYMYV